MSTAEQIMEAKAIIKAILKKEGLRYLEIHYKYILENQNVRLRPEGISRDDFLNILRLTIEARKHYLKHHQIYTK